MNLIKQTNTQALYLHPKIIYGVKVLIRVGTTWDLCCIYGRLIDKQVHHLEIYSDRYRHTIHDLKEYYILP